MKRDTARSTNTENKGYGSTFLKHGFNTGRDKGQARNRDQNTSLAEDLTNSTEKKNKQAFAKQL